MEVVGFLYSYNNRQNRFFYLCRQTLKIEPCGAFVLAKRQYMKTRQNKQGEGIEWQRGAIASLLRGCATGKILCHEIVGSQGSGRGDFKTILTRHFTLADEFDGHDILMYVCTVVDEFKK